MLWTIFVILLVLWLLGIVSSYTLGGFIHILLVLALVTLFQSPGGLNPGGSVCDITNYSSACSFEIQGTQASATGATSPTAKGT